jgi:hypothetical protein
MIVIGSKSERRMGKIIFINYKRRAILIKYAYYQNKRTIRTPKKLKN